MKRIIIGVFLANLLLFGVAVIIANWFFSPAATQGDAVKIVIPKGASANSIGQMLEEKKIIRSALAFRTVVWKDKLGGSLQAGTFTVKPTQTPEEIAKALTVGTDDVWVTFLEGWRAEEFADELGNTLGETFDKEEFLDIAKPEEGFLFPDTYLVSRQVSPVSAASMVRNTFDKKVTEEMQAEAKRQGRTMEEVVTLASIVEREARTSETMRMVAGILQKRLENDWPLQADATLQYIKGYDAKEKTWWPTPLAVDKQLDSRYNTYMHTGLPPGPISNPSLAAIQAALNPRESQYWYYISDLQGNMHYAETLDQHNANVDQYLR